MLLLLFVIIASSLWSICTKAQVMNTPEQIFVSVTGKARDYTINFVTFQSENDQCGRPYVRHEDSLWYGISQLGYDYGVDISKETKWRTHHVVLLSDLRPNTVVLYSVGTEQCGELNRQFHFTVLDPESTSGTFCAFADLDNEHLTSSFDSPLIHLRHANCEFIASIGDISYNLYETQGKRGDAYFNALQQIAAYIPFVFVIGDHEWNKRPSPSTSFAYDIYAQYAQSNRYYMNHYHNHFYSFERNGIHFTALNTDRYLNRTNTTLLYPPNDSSGEYLTWLDEDFQTISTTLRTIVFGHRSVYCHKSLDLECNYYAQHSETFQLQHALEQRLYGSHVELVLSGHTHHYERSWPVFQHEREAVHSIDAYVNPKAPTYVVTGSAGQNCDAFSVRQPEWCAARESQCDLMSFSVITYTASRLTLNQIANHDGSIIDSFSIQREASGGDDDVAQMVG